MTSRNVLFDIVSHFFIFLSVYGHNPWQGYPKESMIFGLIRWILNEFGKIGNVRVID